MPYSFSVVASQHRFGWLHSFWEFLYAGTNWTCSTKYDSFPWNLCTTSIWYDLLQFWTYYSLFRWVFGGFLVLQANKCCILFTSQRLRRWTWLWWRTSKKANCECPAQQIKQQTWCYDIDIWWCLSPPQAIWPNMQRPEVMCLTCPYLDLKVHTHRLLGFGRGVLETRTFCRKNRRQNELTRSNELSNEAPNTSETSDLYSWSLGPKFQPLNKT